MSPARYACYFTVASSKRVDTFDAETMFRSVGADGRGTSPAATDVGRFAESLATMGHEHGLAPSEIATLQRAYLAAYGRASPKTASAGFAIATRFYKVNFELILLRQAATRAREAGGPLDRAPIERILQNLDGGER